MAVGFGRTQPRHQPRKVVRGALVSGFRQLLRIYFRKVIVTGELPSPETTGRVFLPNHVNGLVDPLLVLTTAPCAISPIGKAPLWRIPVLGFLLDAIGAVPVIRRRDDPAKAKGANDGHEIGEILEKAEARNIALRHVLKELNSDRTGVADRVGEINREDRGADDPS